MLEYYILNLPQSADRRLHMKKEFSSLFPRPLHLFTATYGPALSTEKKNAICANPELSDTELGCAISHQRIYEDMLATAKDYAFVFEDDISVNPQVNEPLLQECRQFILERNRPSVLTLFKQRRPCAQAATIGGSIPIYRCSRASGAFAYLLNRAAAEALIAVNTPIRFEADMWMLFSDAGIIDMYATGTDLFGLANQKQSLHSTITTSEARANSSHAHKQLKRQFLREHGYTPLDLLASRITPRWYSLIRKFKK